MLTTACCLVVWFRLGFGLELVCGWVVVVECANVFVIVDLVLDKGGGTVGREMYWGPIPFLTLSGNSLDKLRHTRSVAYSVELVLLN